MVWGHHTGSRSRVWNPALKALSFVQYKKQYWIWTKALRSVRVVRSTERRTERIWRRIFIIYGGWIFLEKKAKKKLIQKAPKWNGNEHTSVWARLNIKIGNYFFEDTCLCSHYFTNNHRQHIPFRISRWIFWRSLGYNSVGNGITLETLKAQRGSIVDKRKKSWEEHWDPSKIRSWSLVLSSSAKLDEWTKSVLWLWQQN